ncbi:MAG: nucleotidyltransferase family protein [Actinomycetota bacterium]
MSGPDRGRTRAAALVVAAGSSKRLGQPKQLLPYRSSTLLGTTLDTVRRFGFGQCIVTVGGAADDVRGGVDTTGFTVVDSVHHTEGCSSSIVAALSAVDDDMDGLFLFLGDQPHIPAAAVVALEQVADETPMALVEYGNGLGHPFWFHRSLFAELATLRGDKAVWKILASGRWPTRQVPVAGDVPLDVDTWDDYQTLLAVTP